MINYSIAARFAVLAISATLAMPMVTGASHIRGGAAPGNCTTQELLPGAACIKKPGQTCDMTKAQCKGCGLGTLKSLCKDTTTAECGGAGCVTGQTDAELDGTTCINIDCPQ